MLKDLIRLANHLDQKGLRKEADHLDSVIRKMAISNSGETKAEVEVKIDVAPGWGQDAAYKLLAALKEVDPELDLMQLMESSFDEEALHRYRYEEEAYHPEWVDSVVESFNKKIDDKWELTGKVDYAKGKFVSFALATNWREVGERVIAVRYSPDKLKISAWGN